MPNILELFGGIGAFTKACKRKNIKHKVVDYVEIDKYATSSYNALNGTEYDIQDIRDWDKNMEVDVIMHGSPCTDYSIAGKQEGGDEDSGTRSSLMWETVRIIRKLRPNIIIWENVKNVLSKSHKHNFDKYINEIERLGYNSYYKVLNAKGFEIPQKRERVFVWSVKKELDNGFDFPEPVELKLRLKDMLEKEVDDKFYLSDKALSNIKYKRGNKYKGECDLGGIAGCMTATMHKGFGNDGCTVIREPKIIKVGQTNSSFEQSGRVYSLEGISPTVMGNSHGKTTGGYNAIKVAEPNLNQIGYINKNSQGNRVYDSENIACTQVGNAGGLGAKTGLYQMGDYRIRKLTPKECWRLMGFDDEDFEKAEKICSNTQLYKQAGNSIVVNVLEAIIDKMVEYGYLETERNLSFK